MKKDAYYFSHDSNARNDEKIIHLRMQLDWEGYGIYWAIIEKLRESKNYELTTNYNLIAFDLRTDNEKIKSIVTGFGLFSIDEKNKVFFSKSLKNRMNIKDEKSKKARENINKRWNKNKDNIPNEYDGNTTVLQNEYDGNTIKGKESKGKESKGKESKGKESKVVVDEFYKNSLSKILKNKKLLEQVSIFNKFPKELLFIIPKKFIDHCEANTTMWENDRDMYKHYQNWSKFYKVEKKTNQIKEY